MKFNLYPQELLRLAKTDGFRLVDVQAYCATLLWWRDEEGHAKSEDYVILDCSTLVEFCQSNGIEVVDHRRKPVEEGTYVP